jgi:hypothetical protein
MYITVTVICCYVTFSLSEAVQKRVTTTAANLPFILLKNLLKKGKTVRKVEANIHHIIL